MPYGAHGVFAALPAGVVFALQGFEQAIQLAGEAKHPQRDVSRAVIAATAIGTLVYLLLEIAFIGALNPGNLIGGWANPVGKGDFGPYATLAIAAGASWLAALLYIDAVVSPAGTGLVYVATSSRLSYALGREGELPGILARLSPRGVPLPSIILAFVIGADRLPAVPELAVPGRPGDVGDRDHVRLRAGVALRATPARPRPHRVPTAFRRTGSCPRPASCRPT